jgi:hypothetical protein
MEVGQVYAVYASGRNFFQGRKARNKGGRLNVLDIVYLECVYMNT